MKQIKNFFALLLLIVGLWSGHVIGNDEKRVTHTYGDSPIFTHIDPEFANMYAAYFGSIVNCAGSIDGDEQVEIPLPGGGTVSVSKAVVIQTITAAPVIAYGIHKMIASLVNGDNKNSNTNIKSSTCAGNNTQSLSGNSVYKNIHDNGGNSFSRSVDIADCLQSPHKDPSIVIRQLMKDGLPNDEWASKRSSFRKQLKRVAKRAVYALNSDTASQFLKSDNVFTFRNSMWGDDTVHNLCNQMLDFYKLEISSIVLEPSLSGQEKKRLLARAFLNFLRNIAPDQYIIVLRDIGEHTTEYEARNTLFAIYNYLTRHKVLFWLRPRYAILPNFFSFIFEDLTRGPQERIICKGLDSVPHQAMFDKLQKLDPDEREKLFTHLASNKIAKARNYVQNEDIRTRNKQRRMQEAARAAQQAASNAVKQTQHEPAPVQQQSVATPAVQLQQKTTPISQQSPPVAVQKEQESQEHNSNDLLDAINNNIEALADIEQPEQQELYQHVELDKKVVEIINDIGIDAAALEQLPIAVEFHQAHMRFMHDLNWHTHRGLEEQSDIGKIMYAAGFEYTTFLAQLNKEGQLSCYAQHEERIRSTPELWVGTIKSVLRISKKFGCAMADSLLHEVSNPIQLTEKLVCGQLYFVGNCIGFVRKCVSVSATTLYHCATDIPGTCESIVTITQQVTHAIKKIPYQEIGKWVDGLPSVTGHDIAQGIHNTMQKLENNDALIEGVAHFATDIMINNVGMKFWKNIYNIGALDKGAGIVKSFIDKNKMGKVIPSLITEDMAKKILHNSSELKILESTIESLKNITSNHQFKLIDDRITDALKILKLYEKEELFYESMRNTANDILQISKNTGVCKSIIQKIKNHLFIEEHILKEGIGRFHANPDIGDAWRRLMNGNFVQSDLQLLLHEYSEAIIMNGKEMAYDNAHTIVNKMYNWVDSV